MENKFIKSDLVRTLIFTLFFIAVLIIIGIWDKKSGILEQIAGSWLL